jgi:hypothetical protein
MSPEILWVYESHLWQEAREGWPHCVGAVVPRAEEDPGDKLQSPGLQEGVQCDHPTSATDMQATD